MNYNDNRKLWADRIATFRESGMSHSQWCKSNEVSLSALRYWLRKSKSIGTDSVVEPETSEFASLDVSSTCSAKSITLEIGSVRIHLGNDFNEALLIKTIRTLQRL